MLKDLPQVTAELAELYGGILGEPCTADTDFFDAGGDSLLATRLISRVYRRFGVELTYVDVFEHPSPAALAELLARSGASPGV